jgi:hypothetical protein
MLLRKKSRKNSLGLYRVHSRLGKFVAVAFVIQGLLGITVLYGILHQNTTTTQTGRVKTVAGETKVFIVPGAGTLGDKGFSPNPINVKVGAMAVEPSIPFIRLRIALRIYMFNKMNTPNITAKDIGNGNKKEIVRLIPKDIPSQTNWLSKYCLLLLMFNLDSHSSILLLYSC